MLRLAIGRVLLWFLVPAVGEAWRPEGEYLRQVAEFGDRMVANAAEGGRTAACRPPG
jgi:hypothetical protein